MNYLVFLLLPVTINSLRPQNWNMERELGMPKVSTKAKSRANLECNRQGTEKISDFLSSSLEAWRNSSICHKSRCRVDMPTQDFMQILDGWRSSLW